MDSKKYKALIVDFDNTLVDAEFKLSPKIKKGIQELINKGFIFSIATGRPYQGIVKNICQDIGLISPQIASGGAEIVDPKNDQVIWFEYFPSESAKELVSYFTAENYDFAAESEGYAFTKNGINRKEDYGPDIVFKDLRNINFNKIAKMILFNVSSIEQPKAMEDKLNKQFEDLHFIRSGRGGTTVLDITSKKATKSSAALALSKILNIDTKLMIGVGDGYNDLPLFSICGFNIALENAPDDLKKNADMIVPDIFNDGLLILFNKLLK